MRQLVDFQIDEARRHVLRELPGLRQRLGLREQEGHELETLFMRALDVNAARMEACQSMGFVAPLPESRALLDFLGRALVHPQSRLVHPEHMQEALQWMRRGGNVLMVQNHTSGADPVVWDHLVNREFDHVARHFGYMAGHVVSMYLIPLTICAGFGRFQIFASKYKKLAEEFGITEHDMTMQNFRALRELETFVAQGGRLIGFYPEGGRGEGQLLAGDPKTAKIGEVIAERSPHGLLVLPTWVEGATSILPVVRGKTEFSEFIQYARAGVSHITCGKPIPWEKLVPSVSEVEAARTEEQTRSMASKGIIHARTMRAIATLAPTEHAKGPWA